jgi:large subunit ribosomal protein L30
MSPITGTTAPAKPGAKKKQLKITLKRSGIGHLEAQRRTLEALKLARPNHVRIVNDTPQIRGMIRTVEHLVQVEEI